MHAAMNKMLAAGTGASAFPGLAFLESRLHARFFLRGDLGRRGERPHSRIRVDFNLDPAVGRARVCVWRAGWLGATRPQGRPCNEEQQRQAARQTRNRVRSVLTQLVMQKKAPE
jgi:hypothetical protein